MSDDGVRGLQEDLEVEADAPPEPLLGVPARELGVSELFVKPVDVQQLMTLLSAYQKMLAEHGG